MKLFRTLAFLVLVAVPVTAFSQKMTADEVVAKHLDSIGTSAARDSVKNRVVMSDVQFTLKGSANPAVGKAVIASAGGKSLWGMSLNSNDYPQDRFGFSGKDVRVAYSRPGVYSIIGGFLRSYKEVVREGLLGGTVLSSWALQNVAKNKAKLSYDGTKTVDGVETHVLGYTPRGGSDLTIKLFFDAGNFNHVRTEYSHVIAARQGSNVDNSAGQSPDRYKVVEDFSNFQKSHGLTIPQAYKLSYSYSGASQLRTVQNAYREAEWAFKITNVGINQDLDPATFDISEN